MSTTIVEQNAEGDLFTTSEVVAEHAGVEHRATLQLINNNIADLEEFGQVAFEMRAGYNNARVRTARLNEQQATLILTYLRNTEQVRTFKKNLVKAFYDMTQRLKGQPTSELDLAKMTLTVIEGLQGRVQELEPKAEFAEKFLSAQGDYDTRDAAQILRRDHGIVNIGQNRLRAWMRHHGWLDRKRRPYQDKIDAGYLRLKASSFKFVRTNGEEQVADPQVRVTPRGVEALARALRKPGSELAA